MSVTVMGEVAAVKLVLVKVMGATAHRPRHRVVEEYSITSRLFEVMERIESRHPAEVNASEVDVFEVD